MLSGLALSAAITALAAGVTGAWSPCGFSMVDTIGSALGDARRGATALACATFTLGALIGGALTFGALAWAGALLGGHSGGLREALGAALALAAAIADWRGLKIAPQIRRQVPERWRWTMPLSLACGLYGILLGLGFTTFVLAFAVWALAGVSFAAASPAVGVLIGLAFGAGRALPVLWMAPGLRRRDGARLLEEMASEPRLWLGLRRLDALGLGLCALFLSTAAAAAAVIPTATDPSAAGGALAWQQSGGGPGMLKPESGAPAALPGQLPALGGTKIAWRAGGQIVIAREATLAAIAAFAVPGASALAVSDGWLVYREELPSGESLVGVSLTSPVRRRIISSSLPASIGRPALDGSTVVFAIDNANHSVIESVNLATGTRRILRVARHGALLASPSLLHGRLLYERVDRCVQQLRVGAAARETGERVLLSLPSTVERDPGYQSGYEHAWNGASLCANRGSGHGADTQLGPASLAPTCVYVTEIDAQGAHIITLAG